MLDRLMTKLAYSRAYTDEHTQKIILAVCYAFLALVLAAYLIFDLPGEVITLGALPGALYFLAGLQAISYRKAIEGGLMDLSSLL